MHKILHRIYFLFIAFSTFIGCTNEFQENKNIKRFELVNAEQSGIDFSNTLVETDSLNYFTYPYMYMGGGVAIGDINNDGLSDLFFTGNLVSNRLYLNQGDFKFQDITISAQIESTEKWYSGVTFIDINSDGYLDIYVCVSGPGLNKENELYINNKDLTFTESAAVYGLNDAGNSVQSSFFDYDHDGDLDVYVANYPITNFTTTNTTYQYLISNPTTEKSDHLFVNMGDGHFQDKTVEAGLLSFGLSLSATVSDFNQDGWEDIYVSNDFSTPDYFYINNGDGTFREELKKITRQTSFYGMGTDAADINNDGLIDLMQVDMSAPDNRRIKANMASMNPALFWSTVNSGFHYQYMYNSLQLNQGLDGDLPVMSNIAWMSGISSTDWSWAPLIADFDNDGWKDIYIANGTRKEINNRDYFKKIADKIDKATPSELKAFTDGIPSEPISNFMFKNMEGVRFENKNVDWNIDYVGFSNGVSYGDLDNDGDLDLVINNIDDKATVYRNNTSNIGTDNYLRIKVKGKNTNSFGIGTEAHVFTDGKEQTLQLFLTRGFQSSIEPILHFGVGKYKKIDSLVVLFQNEIISKTFDIASNQTVQIDLNVPSSISTAKVEKQISMFENATQQLGIDQRHQENDFNDFFHQVLLPHRMSTFGPALAVGDINQDGLEDIYFGAAAGNRGVLMVQQMDGQFKSMPFQTEKENVYEDLDAAFVDLDNDGDLDLYVVSGGNEYELGSENYQDRIYLNNKGKFSRAENVLPKITGSGSCVRHYDFDSDGDQDLFIGGRLDPRNYPFAGESYFLENKLETGNLVFEDITKKVSTELSTIGMVTDAVWCDLNMDGKIELVIVGEWMPITVLEYTDKQFKNRSTDYFPSNTTGWWFSIDTGDFDQDGDQDLIIGNLGLNYKYQASFNEPFNLYSYDFDNNGKNDIVLSYYNYGIEYPVRGRQCSSDQIPAIKVAYKDYSSFSTASTEDIFGTENLRNSLSFSVESFKSIYAKNLGNGQFEIQALPNSVQSSPINDILVDDFNKDGNLDIIVAGNLYASEVETPRSDAGIGRLLEGDGKGNFKSIELKKSGIVIPYDTKKIAQIKLNNDQKGFVAANNNGPFLLFKKNN